MRLRFGIRLGPFYISTSTSTSTRRRRRRRPTRREVAAAEAKRAAVREAERRWRAEGDRIAAMTAEEYREHAMRTDPDFALAELHRQAQQKADAEADLQRLEAELQRLKEESRGDA